MRHALRLSCVVGLLLPVALLAGTVTLKDGTVVEGTIRKIASGYRVNTADGAIKFVAEKDVAKIDDPELGKPATPTPATPGNATVTGTDDFARTSRQAESVDTPLLAVALWQKFLDTHPAKADQAAGQAELARWQQMTRDGAERIKGKWVVGDDLKKLHTQVDKMLDEARDFLVAEQTLKGVNKLQDVLKIYPNSFEANFEMGYYSLKKITRVEGSNKLIDDSIKSLETANRLKPGSPATMTNLAIAYNFRKRYEDSVVFAYKAAQIEDSQEIVQNLFNALAQAPAGMLKNNQKVVPILSDAKLLMERRGVSNSGKWIYVRPRRAEPKGDDGSPGGGLARRGVVGSGTGFFISADGYLLTNRHVAAGGDKLIVRTSDGKYKVAEKVVIDDEQDIAVLKITGDAKTPLPFVKLAAYDLPNVGTDVTVMGFPLGDSMGRNVKITRGVVTSIEDGKRECDVIVDAQVNPGNSGGPMLDKYGNLLALVAMKTMSDAAVSSYGLGISTGRLRKFFDHQKTALKGVVLTKADVPVAASALSTEEIAQKFTKATVMILIVSGDVPEGLK